MEGEEGDSSEDGDDSDDHPRARIRLVHVTQEDPCYPSITGGVIRFFEICGKIPDLEVTLVDTKHHNANGYFRSYVRERYPKLRLKLLNIPKAPFSVRKVLFTIMATFSLVRMRKTYDVIHVDEVFETLIVGFLARLITGKPWICTFQGVWAETFLDRCKLATSYFLVSHADAVVVPSVSTKHLLANHGIQTEKVYTVYLGVDLDAFKPMSVGKTMNAIFVGRLCKAKGVDLLLKAWAEVARRIPSAKLGVVGGGNSDYVELAEKLGLEKNVVFFDWVHHNQIPVLLNQAELFLLPTRGETFCLAIAEALACGLPVVTHPIPAFKELWNDVAIFVAPNAADWVNILLSLNSNRQLFIRLREAGMEHVRKFSWSNGSLRFSNIVKSVLNHSEKPHRLQAN